MKPKKRKPKSQLSPIQLEPPFDLQPIDVHVYANFSLPKYDGYDFYKNVVHLTIAIAFCTAFASIALALWLG